MINKLKELRAGGEEEGFTLIELMIVVVIIGILAAIAIPVFANQQKSAIDAGLKSDVKNTNTNIATALAKAPSAGYIGGTATGTTTPGEVSLRNTAGGDTLATANIVVSDSASTVMASGDWDGYTIVGNNTGTGTTITYTSVDGKIA